MAIHSERHRGFPLALWPLAMTELRLSVPLMSLRRGEGGEGQVTFRERLLKPSKLSFPYEIVFFPQRGLHTEFIHKSILLRSRTVIYILQRRKQPQEEKHIAGGSGGRNLVSSVGPPELSLHPLSKTQI